ncbi:MAG: carbohydrate-binding protein [Niameybacter sp.]|uniref:hypothetical protein n=1 Tax=Niameybacter sp. TaxID=2033640 RepID=UPI002FCC4985
MLEIAILKKDETLVSHAAGVDEVYLVHSMPYEEDDKIVVTCSEKQVFLMLQLDDAIGESLVLLTEETMSYAVPFGEKKVCYSPKSFSGNIHLLKARLATKAEIGVYKNLTLNKYDQHGDTHCFPHASANVETRGESVFAAKNAINGNCENHSHGIWPYESWGINQNPNAVMKVEFGRSIVTDKIRLYTRADFPHDAWWEQATLTFSDGSQLVWDLVKTDKAQEIQFEAKMIEWVEIGNLIKADDPSPFPALSQLEVYGQEA